MNRSLYPEGVEVHQRHLANTESTKAAAIDEVVSDATSRGVVTGLTVTVTASPNNTRVNVAAGTGYAPNGEFMQLATTQTAQQLADSSSGAVNYVLLMYDELNSSPESHETDGTTRSTKATVNPRVVILTTAQYVALPATNPVLSSNALDRALILALVTGNGIGNPLTGGSIQLPTSFQNTLQANQPVNITGVTIIQLDTTTPTGTGTLSYNSGTQQITWQAPGEGSPGSGVSIAISGVYTVLSFTGHTITLNVSATILPSSNKTDSISITNIYTQTIPRFTADDGLHRSMVGSGVPTVKNPHGLTLQDISPGAITALEEHQSLEHDNGITRQSSPNLLACTINTIPAPDALTVTAFSSSDAVYIDGFEINAIVGSNTFNFLDGIAQAATYLVYQSLDGTVLKQVRAQYPNTPLLADKTFIANVSDGIGTASKNLVWTSSGNISFDSGLAVSASTLVDKMVRLFSQDNVNYIDVWIKASATPGSTQTDSISFTALPDQKRNLSLAYVSWSGASTGFLGFGFGTANAPNYVYDKRLFGNTSPANLRDDTGLENENVSKLVGDLLGDGVSVEAGSATIAAAFNNQFAMGTLSGFNITVNGGIAYVGGRRFLVPTNTFTLTNNATNFIYVDHNGVMAASSLSQAQINAAQLGKALQYLWSETITAGAESGRSDLRVYTGAQRNQPLGAVGLDVNSTATITAVNNTGANQTALTITGLGTGHAINATGGASGGDAVVGTGIGIGSGATFTGGLTAGNGVNGFTASPGQAGVIGSASGSGGFGTSGIASSGTGSTGVGVYGGSQDAHAWPAQFQMQAGSPFVGTVNLVPQTTPSAPANGDIWVDTTTNTLSARVNGSLIKIYPPVGPVLITSFLNGFASYTGSGGNRTPHYYRDLNGRVHLSGAITNTGAINGAPAFNLPAGFRPIGTGQFRAFIVFDASSTATVPIGWIGVDDTGNVNVFYNGTSANSPLYLDPVSFDTV